uniref:Uncharacterized protein n=1 Tax=Physcomitrium patens TaxID=3218 RepID=A0A2K1IHH0_PHYPA|nr:hypothetical protein PHYPA_029317 [Physcomitrium patens]
MILIIQRFYVYFLTLESVCLVCLGLGSSVLWSKKHYANSTYCSSRSCAVDNAWGIHHAQFHLWTSDDIQE